MKNKVLENNGRRYVFVGEKDGKRIVVWKDVKDIDLEKDKEIVEENIKEFEPDEIYINGNDKRI